MHQGRASGAPVYIDVGGSRRAFRRLSRRDFAALIEQMPAENPDDRMFLGEYDVHRWAATPVGKIAVLSLSAGVDEAEIDRWGSDETTLTVAASYIVAESLLTGEEKQPAEGEKCPDPTNHNTETLPKRPRGLLATLRAWAIRGRSRPRSGT